MERFSPGFTARCLKYHSGSPIRQQKHRNQLSGADEVLARDTDVAACATAQRTREIGIRMALGAQPRDVMRLILSHGVTVGFVGVGIGIVAALSLALPMRTLLYGVRATDPLAFAGVAFCLQP
jgi:hypothetical protein